MTRHTSGRLLEVSAVVSTGVAHVVVDTVLGEKGLFILSAGLLWVACIARRVRRHPGQLRLWGLRTDNLSRSLPAPTLVFVVVAGLLAVVGTPRLHWHLLIVLIAYPAWGILQQLLVQGLVARNLFDGIVPGNVVVTTLVAAVLFGLVHAPELELVAATFVLGLAFTPMYLRNRNVLPLGIYHGWLGALFYFWVLGRDPVQEILG